MSYRLLVAASSLCAGSREVTGPDYHYLFRVRRARVGDAVTLFDGVGNEARASVIEITASRGVLAVDAPVPVQLAACRITVALALIKGDRMDWCIQKLVELGVGEIRPVLTARTVVQLTDQRAHKRHRRFVDIAANAARQSRRARLPDISEIKPLDQLWSDVAGHPRKLILRTGEPAGSLRDALAGEAPARICVLIGPEGGFTDDEVAAAEQAGFVPVGLGQYVLRSETAAVAAAAVLGVAFGDLAG